MRAAIPVSVVDGQPMYDGSSYIGNSLHRYIHRRWLNRIYWWGERPVCITHFYRRHNHPITETRMIDYPWEGKITQIPAGIVIGTRRIYRPLCGCQHP